MILPERVLHLAPIAAARTISRGPNLELLAQRVAWLFAVHQGRYRDASPPFDVMRIAHNGGFKIRATSALFDPAVPMR
jgi:hypothetical protein